jgi:hypothetical protein
MSNPPVAVHSPAPAPGGPIACTLHPNEFAGRLDDFGRDVFDHVLAVERPSPPRLRLVLAPAADAQAVRALLLREQACCAFMAFTLSPGGGRLVVDLEVPAGAAPVLDALTLLAEGRR